MKLYVLFRQQEISDLVLMQCITNYPSKIDSANVNVLKTYQSAFDVLTGYSDHAPEVISLHWLLLLSVVSN